MGSESKQIISRKLGHRYSIRINIRSKSQVDMEVQEQVILKNTVKEPKINQDIRNKECQQNFLNLLLEAETSKFLSPAIWEIK